MSASDVKTILNITNSDYDSRIAYLLPLVEKDIISYLGHAFQDKYVYRRSSGDFTFVKGDSDTYDYITDDEQEFVENGFSSTMDIVVEGGGANVGYYHLSSASTGTLKTDDYGLFVDQAQTDTKDDNYIGMIRISRVKWPRELRLAAAKMLWFLMDDARPSDVQSERLDDYSVTYAGSNQYPTRVIKMLDRWRRAAYI
jgi:hypothetical protein